MKVNNINIISFRENTLSREMDSDDAILMLRDAKATVKFRQNQEYSRKADSVEVNPIIALGYKLYRAFNAIAEKNHQEIAETADYMA